MMSLGFGKNKTLRHDARLWQGDKLASVSLRYCYPSMYLGQPNLYTWENESFYLKGPMDTQSDLQTHTESDL